MLLLCQYLSDFNDYFFHMFAITCTIDWADKMSIKMPIGKPTDIEVNATVTTTGPTTEIGIWWGNLPQRWAWSP